MTWETDEINEANRRLKNAAALAEAYMPKELIGENIFSGIGSGIKGMLGSDNNNTTNNGNTEETIVSSPTPITPATPSSTSTSTLSLANLNPSQLEAAVIYAEVTLLAGLLYLMEESVMGLVRCGLAIRQGLSLYQRIDKALGNYVSLITEGGPELKNGFTIADISKTYENATPAEQQLAHVRSALLFGMGTFNVVASMLPPIVLKILSFAGIPTNRLVGMELLRQALQMGGVRSSLSGLILLSMRVLMPSFHSGDVSEHIPETQAVLEAILKAHPDSALFLWIHGRQARMRRDMNTAAISFAKCTKVAGALPQLADLCSYELQWSFAFQHNWKEVLPLNNNLQKDNNWSKAFYAYMQAISLLYLGRFKEARTKMIEVLRVSSRKLGGRVIPAEQYAVRRASEFLALTIPFSNSNNNETTSTGVSLAEPTAAELGGANYVRIKLPEQVAINSPAYNQFLVYPLVCPGLEVMYLFNGGPQMSKKDLQLAIIQADTALNTIAAGNVFNISSSLSTTFTDISITTELGDQDTVTLQKRLEKALQVPVNGLSTDASGTTGTGDNTPVVTPSPTKPASSTGGGFFGGLRGLGSVISTVGSAVSTVGSAVGSAVSTVSSLTGVGTSNNASSTYANAKPLLPIHAISILALCRGSYCAGLGRFDEAATCFQYILDLGTNNFESLKRDLHTYAYAAYEMGILYLDISKAITSINNTSSTISSTNPDLYERHKYIVQCNIAKNLSIDEARKKSVEYLRIARGVRDDFNWRVRLHIRVHLAIDDLRQHDPKQSDNNTINSPSSGSNTTDNNLYDEENDANETEQADALAALNQ